MLASAGTTCVQVGQWTTAGPSGGTVGGVRSSTTCRSCPTTHLAAHRRSEHAVTLRRSSPTPGQCGCPCHPPCTPSLRHAGGGAAAAPQQVQGCTCDHLQRVRRQRDRCSGARPRSSGPTGLPSVRGLPDRAADQSRRGPARASGLSDRPGAGSGARPRSSPLPAPAAPGWAAGVPVADRRTDTQQPIARRDESAPVHEAPRTPQEPPGWCECEDATGDAVTAAVVGRRGRRTGSRLRGALGGADASWVTPGERCSAARCCAP